MDELLFSKKYYVRKLQKNDIAYDGKMVRV